MRRINYTLKSIEKIGNAPKQSPGVELGRICVELDYSVAEVAAYLGVTKVTVYSWFYGRGVPRGPNLAKVQDLFEKLLQRARDKTANDNQTQLSAEHTAT